MEPEKQKRKLQNQLENPEKATKTEKWQQHVPIMCDRSGHDHERERRTIKPAKRNFQQMQTSKQIPIKKLEKRKREKPMKTRNKREERKDTCKTQRTGAD